MTLRHLLWARTLPADAFSPASRAVLRSLAEHADAHGRAWPSRRTMARECSLHPRTVQRALRTLRDGGWITPAGARGAVPMWQLASPAGPDASPTRGNTPPPWESQGKDSESQPDMGGLPCARAGAAPPPPTQLQSEEPDQHGAEPGTPAGWWEEVCRLAAAIEDAPLDSPVVEPGGRRRRVALLRFAEWWAGRPFCRNREQPAQEIGRLMARVLARPTVETRLLLDGLRRWPDGAYPATDRPGAPSRMEQLLRHAINNTEASIAPIPASRPESI